MEFRAEVSSVECKSRSGIGLDAGDGDDLGSNSSMGWGLHSGEMC